MFVDAWKNKTKTKTRTLHIQRISSDANTLACLWVSCFVCLLVCLFVCFCGGGRGRTTGFTVWQSWELKWIQDDLLEPTYQLTSLLFTQRVDQTCSQKLISTFLDTSRERSTSIVDSFSNRLGSTNIFKCSQKTDTSDIRVCAFSDSKQSANLLKKLDVNEQSLTGGL